jgi:hypothetical protein
MCFPICLVLGLAGWVTEYVRPVVARTSAAAMQVVAGILASALLAGPVASAGAAAEEVRTSIVQTTSIAAVADRVDAVQAAAERSVQALPVRTPRVPRVAPVVRTCGATPMYAACRKALEGYVTTATGTAGTAVPRLP